MAFENAGLAYFNPHSFRKTLVQFGERLCRTPEQFKAWSQNLGHEKVLTTFSSYGTVGRDRQREILSELSQPDDKNPELERPHGESQVGSTNPLPKYFLTT